jgi:hypothetical protein
MWISREMKFRPQLGGTPGAVLGGVEKELRAIGMDVDRVSPVRLEFRSRPRRRSIWPGAVSPPVELVAGGTVEYVAGGGPVRLAVRIHFPNGVFSLVALVAVTVAVFPLSPLHRITYLLASVAVDAALVYMAKAQVESAIDDGARGYASARTRARVPGGRRARLGRARVRPSPPPDTEEPAR